MLRSKKQSKADIARARAAELAERAEATFEDLSERVRDSDTFARARDRGQELAATGRKRLHDAHLDERASELAATAKKRLHDAHLDERAVALAATVRDADATKQARARARRHSDEALDKVGTWLSEGPVADRLGVQPAKRRFPAWLAGLLGLATGYAIGMFTAPKPGDELRDEFVMSAERLTRDTADVVKARLGDDPRTAALSSLSVNVADGTVFVRGTVPAEFDEAALREIVAAVPGVRDVDLQVSASA